MRELLLTIRALLSRLAPECDGSSRPLAAAAAVALSILEADDLFIAGGAFVPGDGEPPERLLAGSADPLEAAGAAYALQKKNRGGVAVAALASPSDLNRTIDLAMQLNLPLVLLLNCREADVNDISSRVMAAEMECIPADGRSVMKLMPALRLAVDKAREGDGPTLIECVSDQLSEEEDSPDDPLERLNSMLIFEGYATPEELK